MDVVEPSTTKRTARSVASLATPFDARALSEKVYVAMVCRPLYRLCTDGALTFEELTEKDVEVFGVGLDCDELLSLMERARRESLITVDRNAARVDGSPVPGVELRLTSEGRLLLRGPDAGVGRVGHAQGLAGKVISGVVGFLGLGVVLQANKATLNWQAAAVFFGFSLYFAGLLLLAGRGRCTADLVGNEWPRLTHSELTLAGQRERELARWRVIGTVLSVGMGLAAVAIARADALQLSAGHSSYLDRPYGVLILAVPVLALGEVAVRARRRTRNLVAALRDQHSTNGRRRS